MVDCNCILLDFNQAQMSILITNYVYIFLQW